jgi:hypothetical protein
MRRLCFVTIVLAALAAPAAADSLKFSSTIDFTIGALDVGTVHGFAAPGLHGEVGVEHGAWRVQGEVDTALWSIESRKPESGSFNRLGVGLRWYGLDFGSGMRVYGSVGVGRHRLEFSEIDVARNDIALGFGLAQQAKLGKTRIGANVGLRLLVANAPDAGVLPRAVCRGGCAGPSAEVQHGDLGIMMVMGLELGQ